MRPVSRDELLMLEEYQRRRPELRAEIMEHKAQRRLHVGDHLTLLFETHDTAWYQVQEMLRVERIFEESAIQHELDTYNELVPGQDELSATLLVEYEEAAERDVWLRKLLGLEQHLFLEINGERLPAQFDERQIATDRLSAVQFIRWQLPEGTSGRWADLAGSGKLAVVVDHPEMTVNQALSGPIAAALGEDLRSK